MLSSLAYKSNIRTQNRLYMFLASVVLLFAICRGESVGGDLAEYIPLFQRSAEYSSIFEILGTTLMSGYEVGFLALCKFINYLSADSRCFIVVTSILSLIGPLFFINKYSKNKVFSLLLFILLGLYNFSFNNVRQSIAISVVMFAVHFLIQGRKWHFLFLVVLATSMHTSAIFSLLFLPLKSFRYTSRRVVKLTIFGIIIFFVFGTVLFQFLLSNIFTKYVGELDGANVAGTGYGLLCVYIVVVTICSALFKKKKSFYNENDMIICTFLLYSLMLAVLIQAFATYMANITRLANYFYIMLIILVPNIVEYTSNKKFWYMSFFLFYFLLACMTAWSPTGTLNTNSTDTIPYVFLDNVFSL